MALDFGIKQNDTKEVIQITCTDSSGAAVNVTGASISFKMKKPGSSTLKVNAAGAIVTAASGIIKYVWATGDTDTAGEYEAEFQVTFSDSSIQTFPNGGNLSIYIYPQVG